VKQKINTLQVRIVREKYPQLPEMNLFLKLIILNIILLNTVTVTLTLLTCTVYRLVMLTTYVQTVNTHVTTYLNQVPGGSGARTGPPGDCCPRCPWRGTHPRARDQERPEPPHVARWCHAACCRISLQALPSASRHHTRNTLTSAPRTQHTRPSTHRLRLCAPSRATAQRAAVSAKPRRRPTSTTCPPPIRLTR